MALTFDTALGIHERALYLRERRAELLANNLANADTPGFKARDLDFAAALAEAGDSAAGPRRTHARHLDAAEPAEAGLRYRVPGQPSIDGNTVEQHQELARFGKNSLDFESSLFFLSGKFRGLRSAIKGEV